MPNTCAAAGARAAPAGGVRAKNSGSVALSRAGQSAPAPEQRQPQRALPGAAAARSIPRRAALAPRRQHVGPRVRVLVEAAPPAARQLRAPPIQRRPIGVAGLQVAAHRRESAARQASSSWNSASSSPSMTSRSTMRRSGALASATSRRNARRNPVLHVRRDAAPSRQALRDVVGDERVRHQQMDGVVQRRLRRLDVLRQRVQQRLGAVGIAKVDHGGVDSLPQSAAARDVSRQRRDGRAGTSISVTARRFSTGSGGAVRYNLRVGDFTILLVEDDFDVREALAETLRDEGYRVECAVDGEQALDYLRGGRQARPDPAGPHDAADERVRVPHGPEGRSAAVRRAGRAAQRGRPHGREGARRWRPTARSASRSISTSCSR